MRLLIVLFALGMGCGDESNCDEDCIAACDDVLDACVDALEEGDDATECTATWEDCTGA
jgi:hypothetical protein